MQAETDSPHKINRHFIPLFMRVGSVAKVTLLLSLKQIAISARAVEAFIAIGCWSTKVSKHFLGLNANNKPVWSELDKWEYKVIPIKTMVHSDHFHVEKRPVIDDVQNDLNALGDQGWELVTIQDISLADGRMFTVAYLKRKR